MLQKPVKRSFCLVLVRKSHLLNQQQSQFKQQKFKQPNLQIQNQHQKLINLSPTSLNSTLVSFFSTSSADNDNNQTNRMADNPEKAENIYQFKVKDLDNKEVQLEDFKGKVLLVVNTASNCGLTKTNIKGLNELHDKYKDKDFKVLGFPSNDFKQELSCETDIKEFKEKNKIEFPYFNKISVNGNNADPLYKYLKAKQPGTFGNFIKWNYTKFLVDKNGIPVKRYSPTTEPAVIEKDIEEFLNK